MKKSTTVFVENSDITHFIQATRIYCDRVSVELLLKESVTKTTAYHLCQHGQQNRHRLAQIHVLNDETKGETSFNPLSLRGKTVKIALYKEQNDKEAISNVVQITIPRRYSMHGPKTIALSSVKAIQSNHKKDDNVYVYLKDTVTTQKTGKIWVIGSNEYSEFGFGDDTATKSQLTPCHWSANKDFIDIISGEYYTIYLTKDGTSYFCGDNSYGQYVLNSDIKEEEKKKNNKSKNKKKTKYKTSAKKEKKRKPITTIKQIDYFEKNAIAIHDLCTSPFSYHMLWLTEQGQLYAHGCNDDGQLGVGDKHHKYIPMLLTFKEKITAVATAGSYSIALLDNGGVYTVGRAQSGGLGHGDIITQTTEWKHVESLKDDNIIQICATSDSSYFVNDGGNVFSCGYNGYGQLGLRHKKTDKNTPQKIKFFFENNIVIIRVECGWYTVIAVDEKGAIYGFGHNKYGSIGDGTTINRQEPRLIKALKDKLIVDVQCGHFHCAALTDSNQLYLWGKNNDYQCCNGNTQNVTTPKLMNKWISDGTNGGKVLAVSLGHNNTKLVIDDEKDNQEEKSMSFPMVIPSASIPTSFNIRSDVINIDYKPISIMFDCIHNNENAIKLEFNTIQRRDFKKFKQRILRKLQYGNIDISRLKIWDILDDKQISIINEDNFEDKISFVNMLYIEIIIDPPQIEYIDDEMAKLSIILQTDLQIANTFYVEFDGKTEGPITTNNLKLEINDVYNFKNYEIRCKAVNKFGESEWSKWYEYDYKSPVMHQNKLILHEFDVKDVVHKMKSWIYHDINNIKYAQQIKNIFCDHSLNGDKIMSFTANNIKSMVENDLFEFMTPYSVQISLKAFNELKRNKHFNIKTKTAQEISQIIFYFPLFKLIQRIKQKKMNGKMFINNYKTNKQFIQDATGWNEEDIEQIEWILFKDYGITKEEFTKNMEEILTQNDVQSLPKIAINRIRNVLNEFKIETVYYDIKNGRKNFSFSNEIINLVHDLVFINDEKKNNNSNEAYTEDDFVKRLYHLIAECFMFNNSLILKANNWRCINCGNDNVPSYIDSAMVNHVSICNLCGITKRDSIILNLRNYDSFLMIDNHWNMEQRRDTVITFKVCINSQQYHDTKDIDSQHDQFKAITIDSNQMAIYYLRQNIKSAFIEEKIYESLFNDYDHYEFKIYHWHKTMAQNEITNDIELRDIIYGKSKAFMTLRGVFSKRVKDASYFVQITEITNDDFSVRLQPLNPFNIYHRRREYDIKEISNLNKLDLVGIRSNECFGTKDVVFIDDHDDVYEIAVYDQKNEVNQAISNKIKLTRFASPDNYPPNKDHYKPQSVDTLTITTSTDQSTEQINVFWNVPLRTYGKISYQIRHIPSSEQKQDEADMECVEIPTLPYHVPISLTPITIEIITKSTFDEKEKKYLYSDAVQFKIDREKTDDIDKMIEEIVSSNSFDLRCVHRNDNNICPSIYKLCKVLIEYKRWIYTVYINTKGKDDIDKTVKVDVAKWIDDDMYRAMFLASASSITKISQNDIKLIQQMFDEKNGIQNVKTFLNFKRIQFAKTIKAKTKIKPAISVKLYMMILKTLKRRAQTQEFGEFLSALDIESIDIDYHHILNCHINNGDKNTIRNIFRFFHETIHSEDTASEISQCRSAKRKEARESKRYKKPPQKDIQKNILNNAEHKNLWTLKQYYVQSELDNIHSYLAHANWEYFVQRYIHQKQEEKDDEKAVKLPIASDLSTDINRQKFNQSKYVTESSESDVANYGFGLAFSYPYLAPKFRCIFDELLFNTLCRLDDKTIADLLIKSIKKHKIALSEYGEELKCKYYNSRYNILRNEAMGIAHIFVIVTYTDMTTFCTTFRSTYRRIKDETNDEEVKKRHCQFYFYARSLFEAIEFFGNRMEPNLKVYHGLNKVMYFNQFSAYFNQPTSTTPSFTKAHEFSQGIGIILELKSASKDTNDPKQIPKYLAVSWLSNYPSEQEKLFYGENVHFEINDITEASNQKHHKKEMLMLNKFQKTVQNELVKWKKKEKNMIYILTILIEKQQQHKAQLQPSITETYDEEKESKELISEYGQSLFEYFCRNPNTTSIGIKDFKSLPSALSNALLGYNPNEQRISLTPIKSLFINLKQLTLNQLDINGMTADSNHYAQSVINYIKSNKVYGIKLEKITFKSKLTNSTKVNSTLKGIMSRYRKQFQKYNWKIEYERDYTHNLIFTNNSTLKSDQYKRQRKPSSILPTKLSKIPSYFMQITSVDEDELNIEVICDKSQAQKKKLYVIAANQETKIEERIIIKKGQMKGNTKIDIEETHNKLYELALYENQNSNIPIPNSNQIQFIILKNDDKYPPKNMNYKPQPIQLNTVIKLKDGENKNVNIYWSTPSQSFGSISYQIIKDEAKEEEIVESLPYQIDISRIPISFKVITLTQIDDEIYKSNPSQNININSK